MKTRKRLILFSILASGIGAYLLRDYAQYYILFPIVISSRILRILFNAIPQVMIWFLFLFIGGLVIIGSFSRKKTFPTNKSHPEEKFDSRALQYAHWIKTSPKSDYSKWMLARKISELTINLIAFQERLPPENVLLNIRRGLILMPPEVRDYLLAGSDMPSFRHFSDTRNYWRTNLVQSPLELNPEIIINYLESRF